MYLSPVQVRLKTRYGQYLRANKGLPPWRNSITHDIPHRSRTSNWVLWDVDLVELRPQPPKTIQGLTPIETSNNSCSNNFTSLDRSPSPSSAYSPSLEDDDSLAKIDLQSSLPNEVCFHA